MHCDRCGLQTFRAVTENGAHLALQVRPHPDGDYRVDGDPRAAGTMPRAYRLGPLEIHAHHGELYADHAEVCPDNGERAERRLVDELERGEASRPASRRPHPGEGRGL